MIHVATLNGLHVSPEDYEFAVNRERMIRAMAYHLVAGTRGGLNLTSESHCIQYLRETEERWQWKRDIEPHFDAAMFLAFETIIQASMSLR